jgi:uncharacterized protein (TIGR04551 family)
MLSFSPARGGRLLFALAGLLAATSTLAQVKSPAPDSQPATSPAPAAPAASAQNGQNAQPAAPATTDEATREAIRREVEKAKQEIRDEVRAEMQGQQSAKEFMAGAEAEERKLQFFEVNGYYRVRTSLFDGLDLNRGADPGGFLLYPRPLISPDKHSTLTSANMRLRLEPTLNVSEQIRVYAQVDALDNVLLGASPDTLAQNVGPTLIPVGVRSQLSANSVQVKRVWAEVQTPVGLLAFGRQRAEWGLGVLDHAGQGIDDDLGSTVDRIQFAIPLRSTPIGPLTLIPMYDLMSTGVTNAGSAQARLTGQAIDSEPSDDAKAIGVKVARMETAEERKLKLDQGLSSWNWGLYYSYRSQGYDFPLYDQGLATTTNGTVTDPGPSVRRNATAHVVDVWGRWEKKKYRLEWEATGIVGNIENASNDPLNPTGQVLIRQFGGVLQGAMMPTSRWTLGGEFGIASGDHAPGFGNYPGRGYGVPGVYQGATFNGTTDRDFRNFQFNPAYRVDQILFREILGAVTEAWYLKPSVDYELIDGLVLKGAIIYSQAMYASTTPDGSHTPLGLEGDFGIHYKSDDGFIAWVDYGVLQPLSAFDGAGHLVRGQSIRTGLAVKF